MLKKYPECLSISYKFKIAKFYFKKLKLEAEQSIFDQMS